MLKLFTSCPFTFCLLWRLPLLSYQKDIRLYILFIAKASFIVMSKTHQPYHHSHISINFIGDILLIKKINLIQHYWSFPTTLQDILFIASFELYYYIKNSQHQISIWVSINCIVKTIDRSFLHLYGIFCLLQQKRRLLWIWELSCDVKNTKATFLSIAPVTLS